MYANMLVGLEKIYDQNGGKCNTRPTSDNTCYLYNWNLWDSYLFVTETPSRFQFHITQSLFILQNTTMFFQLLFGSPYDFFLA
jgi:hypothetical protein